MRKGLCVLLVALPLAGCGGATKTIVQTVEVPAETTATTAEPTVEEEPAPEPEPEPATAGVGDVLTLTGMDDVQLKVKLVGIVDPVPGGEFDEAEGRFVGVKLKFTNVGDAAYDDAPANGATLITRGDEQIDMALMTEGECSGSFASSVKLAPGASRVGCIPFDVPAGKRLKTFQFTLDSGFADETGEWTITGAKSARAGGTGSAAGKQAAAPASTPAPAEPAASPAASGSALTSCDANIEVDASTTTCAFAQNLFYEYWAGGRGGEVTAWSPSMQAMFDASCAPTGDDVLCSTADGSLVRFPQSAVDAYTQSAADAYAASHDLGP